MKTPAFQFYASDFFDGTAILSQAETGAYIRLLCQQWNRGSLPVQPELLQRLAGGEVTEAVIDKFPVGTDGLRRNARLEKERDKQTQYRELQRLKGIASGKSRRTAVQPRLNRGSDSVAVRFEPEGNSPLPSPSPIDATNKQGRPTCWPTLEETIERGQFVGVAPEECEKFYHHYESMGWVDKNGNPIRNWQSKLSVWKISQQEKTFIGKNGTDPYWKDKSRFDMVEKEIAAITARASHTAMDVLIQPQDKESYTRLKKERKELKVKLKLSTHEIH